ncbi:HAMP domain-containing sensor histidine kinase [Nesterenkonia sp. F]|uniref:sensor histidine kinase n=1 Tax=Nesterenkonia sp. F TaxID=795955 RepID=UPI000255D38F|nr:HAMP domain-containing sensor histidine kinase [Nesterenkonia sp. F]
MSVRVRLTLSYAGFLVLAGGLLLAVVWVFLLRYVPDRTIRSQGGFVPARSDLVEAFAPAALAALTFLLVIGLAGGWILAGRMLRPLDRITEATRAAADGSLAHRIALAGRQDEFRELADAFDTMMARIESHVAEQRRFAANASHELRTPLATTRMLLDVARDDPDRGGGELIDRLRAVNDRAVELTEALLLLSRAEQGTFDMRPVELSLIAEEVAEDLLPLAERRGAHLEVVADAAPTAGSETLLTQLAANLVQNAIVHNLPSEGRVVLRTAPEDDGASPSTVLTVENTGELLSPAHVAVLAEPFQRGAGRSRSTSPAGDGSSLASSWDHTGAGLGLAIARRIVEAHGGTLELSARPTGGLLAVARLPPASHP